MEKFNELAVFEYSFNAECLKPDLNIAEIDERLAEVNKKLEEYTNQADKFDYAVAVGSGILCGLIDSILFKNNILSLTNANKIGDDSVKEITKKVASAVKGEKITEWSEARDFLESFHMASDGKTAEFGGGLQHHLRDFTHHGSIFGLFFSILSQFTGCAYGTDTAGKFISVSLQGSQYIGVDFGSKLWYGVINWFLHLTSDVAGASGTIGTGTGIPGPLLSLAKVLSSTKLFNNDNGDTVNNFSVALSKVYNGTQFGERDANGKIVNPVKFDLRTEIGIKEILGKQALSVIANEIIVKAFYFIRRLVMEIKNKDISNFRDFNRIDWQKTLPYKNRTIIRMITISSATFMAVDMTDALIRTAAESTACLLIAPQRIISRINYVNMGRLAISIGCEAVYEYKEEKYLREKLELTAEKSEKVVTAISEYRQRIDSVVSNYLAQDIQQFLNGFDEIDRAILKDDADGFIHGNVTIQSVLGRKPQFTNQEEFDELMASEEAFVL